MKRFLSLVLSLLMVLSVCSALAQDAATPTEVAYEPLPLSGPAPYAPIADAFGADGMSYDDGTLSIRIETDVAHGTNIYYVYVTLTDASQMRTAIAGSPKSKAKKPVLAMAEANNAVLAINGDYFGYHTEGMIVRGGEQLRFNPHWMRDTLIIDENGDFNFLTFPMYASYNTMKTAFDSFEGEVREAFAFGPALIIDGEKAEFNYKEKTSCGYPTPAQRLAFCQLDTLSYLIVATEGPEQDKAAGLSIPQLTELCLAKGAKQAYNLDGGSSVTIILGGQRINAPESKDRSVSDIIYFSTLRAQ